MTTDPLDEKGLEAEALRIAYKNLIRLGWKFDSEDIGRQAARILKAMRKEQAID